MNIITRKPKEDRKTIDKEVERLIAQMETLDPTTDEYANAAKNLKTLCEARGIKTNRSISTDTLIAAGVNLLGIVLVLEYEQIHVITSKAFGLVFRGGRG